METGNVAGSSGSKRNRGAHDTMALSKSLRVDGKGARPSRKSPISKNYLNFIQSGLPRCLMYYHNNDWRDFPEDVTMSLVEAFRVKRSAVEVSMGESSYVVDLLNMILIDLKGGVHRAVAWIDESGKCFFPVDDGCGLCNSQKIKLDLVNGRRGADNPGPVDCNMVSGSKQIEVNPEVKEEIGENVVPCLAPADHNKVPGIVVTRRTAEGNEVNSHPGEDQNKVSIIEGIEGVQRSKENVIPLRQPQKGSNKASSRVENVVPSTQPEKDRNQVSGMEGNEVSWGIEGGSADNVIPHSLPEEDHDKVLGIEENEGSAKGHLLHPKPNINHKGVSAGDILPHPEPEKVHNKVLGSAPIEVSLEDEGASVEDVTPHPQRHEACKKVLGFEEVKGVSAEKTPLQAVLNKVSGFEGVEASSGIKAANTENVRQHHGPNKAHDKALGSKEIGVSLDTKRVNMETVVPQHGREEENDKVSSTENLVLRHRPQGDHRKASGFEEIKVSSAVEVAHVENAVLLQSHGDDLHNVPTCPEIDIEVTSKVREVTVENLVQPMEDPAFAFLRKKLIRLERQEPEFIAVQNTFLIGFGGLITPLNLVGIYRYSPAGPVAIARLKSFEKQIEITTRYRGYANVCGGWHGSSREGVIGIILHGFWTGGEPVGGSGYGNGIYLSPDEYAHISACYSEVDKNGIQHMVFCRAIMGKMEQVQPGANQFRPSSENFDSGVDDLRDPKHYVVWPTRINTHIHPEYIVSFTLPPSVREHLAGKRDVQGTVDVVMRSGWQVIPAQPPETNGQNTTSEVNWPTSGWLPFSMLFQALQHRISPFVKEMLIYNCNLFKSKRITRKQMVQKLRMLVGDDLLLSTLKRLQLKPPFQVQATQATQQMPMRGGPQAHKK